MPYRVGALLERPKDAPAYVVEGERDADRLFKLGLVATCNAGGAGKWRDELSAFLCGATVYILPDNDDAGRKHAQQVGGSLHGTAVAVRVVELPGLPPKGDVTDWLAAGGTREQLVALCEAAPVCEPTAEDADHTFIPQDIEDLDRGEIPPRQWLLSTILCRRFVTVLAASGGSGKTTLLLAWALSLAVGRALIGDHVHKRPRVLVLTFEDDVDEYRRRLRAARMHHGIGDVGHGWCHVVSLAGIGITLAMGGKDGALVETDAAQDHRDPPPAGRRRDVRSIHQAERTQRERQSRLRLYRPDPGLHRNRDQRRRPRAHHFRKGLAEAGNIDAARGARAIIDASRLALTLVPMSADEAQTLGVSEEERRRLVRLDECSRRRGPSPPAIR